MAHCPGIITALIECKVGSCMFHFQEGYRRHRIQVRYAHLRSGVSAYALRAGPDNSASVSAVTRIIVTTTKKPSNSMNDPENEAMS